jgi:pilus assembly protein FimV
MFERKLVQCVLLGLMAPASALALGLGEIHLNSALNSPLDAEIDITGASAEELGGLKAALASRDSFARYGLDYPTFLGNVRMQVGRAADGRNVIRVQSTESVTEPFATLLVDVNWARGHLVREYTVLVDPPVFTPAATQAPAAVAAPVAGASARSSSVERAPAAPAPSVEPTPSAASAPSVARTPAAAAGGAAPGSTYQVRRGDTLSGIATEAYGSAARQRGLVAIYRANPAAFERNMNELHSGAQLQLPTESDVDAVGPAEAAAEVRRQYVDWSQARASAGGQLRLVPPQEPGAAGTGTGTGAGTGGSGTATGADTGALQQRVNQLEAQLAEQRRLVELRNAELAEMQRKLGQPVTPTPAPPVAAAPPAAATTPPEAAAQPEAAATPPAAAPESKPEVAKAAARPKPTAAAEGGSIFDWIIEHWYVPLGLLVALVAGFFGMRKMREREGVEFDRSLDRLSTAFEEPPSFRPRQSETQTLRALPDAQAEAFLVEESGTHEQPRISPAARRTAAPAAVEVDDTVSGDTSMPLAPGGIGEGDPLAEADFHMAYGLYDQAADLIKIAISREPQRRDLKLKLLEVFFVWGNREQFLVAARELAATRDQALPGEWEKTVIMGRQIAPEDPLFAGSGTLGGAASAGVDLNLEGGQNRIDFDLLGEPSVTLTPEDVVDLDLGAALGDKDKTGESKSVSDTGVDFVLDDPLRGAESTGITREMPEQEGSQSGVTAEVTTLDTLSGDAPTVEQPQLVVGDHPTIRQKLEPRAGDLPHADRTAEVALDDLGLDLGALEGAEGEVSFDATGESPTLLASLEETARERMSSKADTGKTSSTPGISESGTWLFTDNDLASMLPPEETKPEGATELVTAISPAPRIDTSMTGQIAALKVDGLKDIDLDVGSSADATGMHKMGPRELLDFDLGASQPAGPNPTADTQRLAVEQALPDLEPATMSEVGTKLDLARAYMDMGDPEGARSILEEVLSEGSVSQKQEARRLIDSLPG